MYNYVFTSKAFEQYQFWQKEDRKILKKINELLQSIARDGVMEGIGKPEKLRENLSGLYSRRISHEHRLVYYVKDENIIVVACKFHY